MKDRLKELRKELGLNQEEFASKLKIGRSTIANYEAGTREPIASVISLICQLWNVNEIWLRTGQGDMFVKISRDDELLRLIDESMTENLGDLKRRLALAIMKLTPEQMKICTEWIKDTFNLVDRDDAVADRDDVERTIEEKVAAYRAELEAEAASKGKSSASQTAADGESGSEKDA